MISKTTLGLAALLATSFARPGSGEDFNCDRTRQEFERTGTIRCGHFSWELHPEHARRLEDPLALFARHESLYRFLSDFTGFPPDGTLRVSERCGPDGPTAAACSGGRRGAQVYRAGGEIIVDPALLAEARGAQKEALFDPIAREVTKLFDAPRTRALGYAWDPALRESWAETLVRLAYGIHEERLDSTELDRALAAYETTGLNFDDLSPVPPADNDALARGRVLSGMLASIHRELRAAGRDDRFLQGLRGLLRFYRAEFPYPASWTNTPERDQDRALLRRKAELFVFLLSAFLKEDLTPRFRKWRWPVSAEVRGAVADLARLGWGEQARLQLLTRLLTDAPLEDQTVEKRTAVAKHEKPKAGGTAAAALKPGSAHAAAASEPSSQVAPIEPVVSAARSIENGAVVPRPAASGGLRAAKGGGFGDLLSDAAESIGGFIKGAVAPVSQFLLPQRDPNRPGFDAVSCRFLIYGCSSPAAEYQRVSGKLFVKGPGDRFDIDPGDVDQNAIGDCYLMSSLASIAKQNHELIRERVSDNQDGTYSVTLHERRGWDLIGVLGREERKIVVDSQFPLSGDRPIFAGFGDREGGRPELWVLVVEKAFAQASRNGSYNSIGNGGFPSDAMERLLGTKSETHPAKNVALSTLKRWDEAGAAVAVATKQAPSLFNLWSSDPLYDDENGKLEFGHAYWLKGFRGDKIVMIGNPWGPSEEVELTEAEFRRALDQVYVNPLK